MEGADFFHVKLFHEIINGIEKLQIVPVQILQISSLELSK